MTRSPKLAVNPREMEIIRNILARHLPHGINVVAFGSRAGGTPKPWSDLDLALMGPGLLPLTLLAELGEAFDESDLPWKVDIVDRRSVSDSFGAIIDEAKIPLT